MSGLYTLKVQGGATLLLMASTLIERLLEIGSCWELYWGAELVASMVEGDGGHFCNMQTEIRLCEE